MRPKLARILSSQNVRGQLWMEARSRPDHRRNPPCERSQGFLRFDNQESVLLAPLSSPGDRISTVVSLIGTFLYSFAPGGSAAIEIASLMWRILFTSGMSRTGVIWRFLDDTRLNLRYEDYLADPDSFVRSIGTTTKLAARYSRPTIIEKSTKKDPLTLADYRKKYQERRIREKICPEDIAFINDSLDHELMKKFSYEIIGGKNS